MLEEIGAGSYNGGKRLPTEKELAKMFFVSRITSKRAMDQLAHEDIIIRIPGKGSFLKADSPLTKMRRVTVRDKKSIALVMGGYSSSFGLDVLNGAIETSQSLGLHLIVKATNGTQQNETDIIKSLLASNVAGIMIQPVQYELYSPMILQLALDGFPMVMLDRRLQGIDVPFVGVDNAALSETATEKIIDQGHTNISLMAMVDKFSSTISDRIQGFTNVCVNHTIPVGKKLWLTNIKEEINTQGSKLTGQEEYNAMLALLKKHLVKHPEITAIFGTEYKVSKAARDAVRSLKMRVPQDISIVSFDNDSSYFGPHILSHIKQPQTQMGTEACNCLNNLLCGKPPTETICLLPGKWNSGATLGPVRGSAALSKKGELSI